MQTATRVTENKFKEGDIVYAIIAPTIKLVIRRYAARIYYCKIANGNASQEIVYFERELIQAEHK
jgi:hypothetical protein